MVTVVYEGLVKEEEMWYMLKFGSEVERGGLKGVSLLGDFAGLGVKWRVIHAHAPGPLYLHDKSNNVTTEIYATQKHSKVRDYNIHTFLSTNMHTHLC